MIKFKRFWRDFLLVFVPTLLILLVVYIFLIYPNDRIEMSQFDEANEIYRDMNATTFRYGIFMILFVSWAVAHLYAVSLDAYKLKFAMPISVPAKLKAKEIKNYMVPRAVSISTAYELTFELENKEVKRFYVSPEKWSLFFENNSGILTYKEHSKVVFVDFEVLEING